LAALKQWTGASGLDRAYEYGVNFELSACGVFIDGSNAMDYKYSMFKK